MLLVSVLKLDKSSVYDSFDEDELILPASEVSLTIPADFPDVLAETVGPTFRNKTELKSVHPQFYKRKPSLLRELELSKEEKMDILGRLAFQAGIEDEVNEVLSNVKDEL